MDAAELCPLIGVGMRIGNRTIWPVLTPAGQGDLRRVDRTTCGGKLRDWNRIDWLRCNSRRCLRRSRITLAVAWPPRSRKLRPCCRLRNSAAAIPARIPTETRKRCALGVLRHGGQFPLGWCWS